jgi:hypothetical protein
MVVAPGTRATLEFDRLALPTGDGYLMATIPILGTPNYYTVERREFVGFDLAVPGEAIVIHEVRPGRSRPAQVVDPDGDGDPNDDGAIWIPGEKWTDPTGNIHVMLHTLEIFVVDQDILSPPRAGFGLGLGAGVPSTVPRFLVTIVNG